MQLFKRLLRAHWSALALLLLSFVLLVAAAVWLVVRLFTNYLTPSTKPFAWAALVVGALVVAILALKNRMTILMLVVVAGKLRASRPRVERSATLEGLGETVNVAFDQFGIPTIEAKSRLDAMRALGYVSARDRLFQMDLLRRGAAGRLTEVFGKGLLEIDKAQRVIGFNRIAGGIVEGLPQEQKELLQAYSEGVNAYLSRMKSRPFEFLLLNYRPENWTSEHCVLALLRMFQNLCAEEEGKRRTLAVMERTLPEAVFKFLTPDTDAYATVLGWGNDSHRPVRPLPSGELAALLGRQSKAKDGETPARKIVQTEALASGSNCWAVDKSKTEKAEATGGAILSNDMHTGLGVPNLWYRARLLYDGVDLSGVTIPGIPLVLAGSNTHVAWGLTNMLGACIDLIQLEIDPERPDHYMTPEGWKPFELLNEPVRLKRGDIVDTEVKTTIWGPVLLKTLLGGQVALRWTALDADGVDFGLMRMEKARTIEEAVGVVNRFVGPPLNVVVADDAGRIAYTVCGRFPVRRGDDNGAPTNRSWADGSAGWSAYVHPDELPRIVESPEGFLVNANNRSIGRDYPYVLGEGFPNGYRAYRIAERLREMSSVTEADMFALQSDTACEVYEFYRQLALEILTDEAVANDSELEIVRRDVGAWDGRAELDSRGLVFITYFRESLAQSVLTPLLRACAEADEEFVYTWPNLDTPLRIILTERPPELLFEPERYATWEQFLLENLKNGVARLREKVKAKSLENLSWGEINRAEIWHPLAQQDRSLLGGMLNMPEDALPGCHFSVCSSEPGFGASVRMVVSPGRESAGVLHIACGQSGHPLSSSYDDQHAFWARHEAVPFLPGPASRTLTLSPSSSARGGAS
jgi:penicillin amidase